MIRARRLLAVLLTVALLAGLSLHASASAGMTDTATAPTAGAVAPDGGCDGCGDDEMDETTCAAVCAGVIAVLPVETAHALPLRPGFPAAPARSAHGRASPPATSPPDSNLG